jgi:hypothetical protein
MTYWKRVMKNQFIFKSKVRKRERGQERMREIEKERKIESGKERKRERQKD